MENVGCASRCFWTSFAAVALAFLWPAVAVAAHAPNATQGKALVHAAHRKVLLEREEGPAIPGGSRSVNRALPWGTPGCCTISALRISSVSSDWAEGEATLVVAHARENEALLFERVHGTWTLVEVGRGELSGNIAPRRVLRDLESDHTPGPATSAVSAQRG